MKEVKLEEIAMGLVAFILVIIPYITHLLWSLSGLFTGSFTQTNEYVVAGLGIVVPPFGWVHGLYLCIF